MLLLIVQKRACSWPSYFAMLLSFWIILMSIEISQQNDTNVRHDKQRNCCTTLEFIHQISNYPYEYCGYMDASLNEFGLQLQMFNETVADLKKTHYTLSETYDQQMNNHSTEMQALNIKVKEDSKIVKSLEMKCNVSMTEFNVTLKQSNDTLVTLKQHNIVMNDTIFGEFSKHGKQMGQIENKLSKTSEYAEQHAKDISELWKIVLQNQRQLENDITRDISISKSGIRNLEKSVEDLNRQHTVSATSLDESIKNNAKVISSINTGVDNILNSLNQLEKKHNETMKIVLDNKHDTDNELSTAKDTLELHAIDNLEVKKTVSQNQRKLKRNIMRESNRLENIINVLKDSTESLSGRLATLISDLTKQADILTKDIEHIQKGIANNSDNLKSLEKKYNETMMLVLNNKNDFETEFNKSRNILNVQLTDLNKTLLDLQAEKDNLIESITATRKLVETTKTQIEDVIYPNTFNKVSVSFVAVAVVAVVCGNTIAICVIWKRTPTIPLIHRPAFEKPANRIERNHAFETSVCVLSFDDDTQEHHKRLTKSIIDDLKDTSGKDIQMRYHIIHKHEDIPGIPKAKLTLMFTEFTERHVIIEQPGIGLGDLKRRTYEAICTAGGCLVIIYVKDPGSRRIPEHKRYNENIDCVTSQPELSVLNDRGYFFSVYDCFTNYQRRCLHDIVSSTIA